MKTWIPSDIKKLRSKLGLSQPAFGERIGVTGNYVYMLEKGDKRPSKTLTILFRYIQQEAR